MRWTKKLGPQHRMNGSTTLCGRPMLGNNYDGIRESVPDCERCETIYSTTTVKDECGCNESQKYKQTLELIVKEVKRSIGAFEGSFEANHYQELADIASEALE